MAAVIAAVLVCAVAAPSPAAAASGKRVTVAIVGDSVVEGLAVEGAVHPSLTELLPSALATEKFSRGGTGFRQTNPFSWTFDAWSVPQLEPLSAASWSLTGGPGDPADDGPSGYAATAISPGRAATVPVRNPLLGIIYLTSPDPTVFRVRAGGRTWNIDATSPGDPQPVTTWLSVAPGVSNATVFGPQSGKLVLLGAIGRRPLPAKGVQVEVSNLGHAGRPAYTRIGERALVSFDRQRYDVVVFLWSYISELFTNNPEIPGHDSIPGLYETVLRERAGRARSTGAICIVADSTPMPTPPAIHAEFTAIHKRVARATGCSWTPALGAAWGKRSVPSARAAGLVHDDGFHPTVAGYRLMAKALTPVITTAVQKRLKHPLRHAPERVLAPVGS